MRKRRKKSYLERIGDKKYTRKCPSCGKPLYYDCMSHKKRATKSKSTCNECRLKNIGTKMKNFNKTKVEKICSCGQKFLGTKNQTDCKECKRIKVLKASTNWKKKHMEKYGITSNDMQMFNKEILDEYPELLKVLQIKNKIKNYE